MRHVGSLLFAPALCRKLAKEATFSWHLPRCKKQEPRFRHSEIPARGRASIQRDAHTTTSPVIPEWFRNDGEEEEEEEK
ncbi:hypothetical protein XI09_00460 [Bradyrhizobium sp. CCBAU 11386]|nr:hypothetical protein [Bradyrhizobium sp. CCBAU 11386]